MKPAKTILLFTSLFFSFLFAATGYAQTISNQYYTVTPAADFQRSPAFIVEHKGSKLQRRIAPKLKLVFANENLELTGAAMDGQPGVVAWKTANRTTTNINELGSVELTAHSYQARKNQLLFRFKDAGVSRIANLFDSYLGWRVHLPTSIL